VHRACLALVALALAGCTANGTQDRFLAKYADPEPRLEAVTICHGYGCRLHGTVSLAVAWPRLVAPLAEPAPDAAAERVAIAAVVAAIENEVGARLGTTADVGGTFSGFAEDGQLDCIDEAANTTTFLTLMQADGLLVWHEVRAPMSRGFFVNGWPHTSAVIAETADGTGWVVDSWFHANGGPVEVVPLDTWLAGWSPEGSEAEIVVVAEARPAADLPPPPRSQ